MARNNELLIFSTRELEYSKVESEILESLRKLVLPYPNSEAPKKMERPLSSSQERAFHVNRACEMICELTHCEANQRQIKYVNNTTSHSQELKLLMHLFDYFCESSENIMKIAVFLTLFGSDHSKRWPILAKLVSMAISVNNADILVVTSILACQLSDSTQLCNLIVDRTVYDFIFLYPENISKLKGLPSSVPTLCNIFMKTVTEMYGQTDANLHWTNVPNILLEVLIEWIEKYSSQLISKFGVNYKLYLPVGQTMSSVLSPYPGLLKWIILSSLHEENKTSQQLFIKLHNAVCGSLVMLREEFNRMLIPCDIIISIVESIKSIIKLSTSDEKVDDCLIRLAQIIQLGMHSEAIQGDLDHLRKHLNELLLLRPNRLLEIVVSCLNRQQQHHKVEQLL